METSHEQGQGGDPEYPQSAATLQNSTSFLVSVLSVLKFVGEGVLSFLVSVLSVLKFIGAGVLSFLVSVLSVLKFIGLLIIFILIWPLLLLLETFCVFFTGCYINPLKRRSSNGSDSDNIYVQMLELESTTDRITSFNAVNFIRPGCVALLWLLALILYFPRLASVMLFGGLLWKWSLFLLVILLGYPAIILLVHIFLDSIDYYYNNTNTRMQTIYYWVAALTNSLITLLYMVFLLVMWLVYFRTDHGLHPYERFDHFATRTTLAPLLVGAFLWVSKSAALLKWKGNAVYMRFKDRILTAGFKLYFRVKIDTSNQMQISELTPWRDDFNHRLRMSGNQDWKNLHIKDYWSSKPLPIYRIAKVALYLMNYARVTRRKDDVGINNHIVEVYQRIAARPENAQRTEEECLREVFRLGNEDVALILLHVMKRELMTDKITFDAFQKWMFDVHKNCQYVGFTLIDAFAVISVLNKVLMGVIVVVVIVLWPLITGHGLGKTNVLVLAASPLIAFSFAFGDTCKTFLQGIIFSFVTHPFDIGDRCIIDGIELEVKRIRILTTMFVKIGTKEKVLYSNTSLAMKVIANLEGEPDPSDMIVLTFDSSTPMSKIESFQRDLESFFKTIDHGSYEKAIRVAVDDIGSSIKVGIYFTHVMNVQDVSHSQCLLKKKKRRSELLVIIKQFLEYKEIKLAA